MTGTPTLSPDAEARGEIALELRKVEVDTVYSFKGHFSAAARWNKTHSWLGIPSALLAGLAGISAVKNEVPWLTISLALLSAGLTSLMTFLKPNEKSRVFLSAGNSFKALNSRSRIARRIDLPLSSLEDARKLLHEIVVQRNELNNSSPQIPDYAYRAARNGILAGEADYPDEKADSSLTES